VNLWLTKVKNILIFIVLMMSGTGNQAFGTGIKGS
jgi:hypothetical protein